MRKNVFFLLLLSSFYCSLPAQTINKYGVSVITSGKKFKKSVKKEDAKAMVSVLSVTAIQLDLRYASDTNFMHTRLYPPTQVTFLRKPAVAALAKIQDELIARGLSLVIWDAYRPYSVTERMWDKIGDPRYVADPAKGSGHNRGLAVDLTIRDISTGAYLDMGTGYDDFTDTAHHNFKSLSAEVLNNRKLLKDLMIKYGFLAFDTEWWHYYLPNDKGYELLDLSFDALNKLQKKRYNLHNP